MLWWSCLHAVAGHVDDRDHALGLIAQLGLFELGCTCRLLHGLRLLLHWLLSYWLLCAGGLSAGGLAELPALLSWLACGLLALWNTVLAGFSGLESLGSGRLGSLLRIALLWVLALWVLSLHT